MTIDWAGKRVLLLGYGGEARATLSYLRRHHTPASISVADQSTSVIISPEERTQISQYFLGEEWLRSADVCDIVIRSPGVPPAVVSKLRSRNPRLEFTSGTNIFLSKNRDRTFGITGTKGKSTTSSLLSACLNASGLKTILCGNIGIPALSVIDEPADIFVMELSSYQLEDCTASPHWAALLNLYPEHLDHHRSLQAYESAKQRICSFQKSGDYLILPAQDEKLAGLSHQSAAERIYFGAAHRASWIDDGWYLVRDRTDTVHRICRLEETLLKGPGNVKNILTVLAALSCFDFDRETLSRALCDFQPLPHRLEVVAERRGITFVNDSISTVPEATINALETYQGAVSTLIAGGYDRGLSFDDLARYLDTSSVRRVILFPPSGQRLRESYERLATRPITFDLVSSMKEAIDIAMKHGVSGTICLLSPSSPSFPIFKNFEERGAQFREQVLLHD
jgi:UDP-N-acetylmuramoylalanine--D-glutamate ligase